MKIERKGGSDGKGEVVEREGMKERLNNGVKWERVLSNDKKYL